MNKKSKKLLITLCFFALMTLFVFCGFGFGSEKASEKVSEKNQQPKLTVVHYASGYANVLYVSDSGLLEIPETYQGKPVTSLYIESRRSYLHSRNSYVFTKIIIPSSLVQLTFNRNYYVKEFVVDENNPNFCVINNHLYDKNGNLVYLANAAENLIIPSGVVQILELTKHTKSLSIPSSVEYIKEGTFDGASNLTQISVHPDNQYYEAKDNFLINKETKCVEFFPHNLQSVAVPEGVATLPKIDSTIKSLIIPSSVKYIEEGTFNGASNLTQISVHPDNQYYEAKDNFLINKETKCVEFFPRNLQNVSVPEGVFALPNIRYTAKSLTIPASVEYIAEGALDGAHNLTQITIHPDNEYFEVQNNILINKKARRVEFIPLNLKTVIIPEGICEIANACQPSKLGIYSDKEVIKRKHEKIIFPESLDYIGDYAFYNCKSLKSITLPQSMKSIGKWAFGFCKSLKKVSFPLTIDSIGAVAFGACHSLKTAILPQNLTKIPYSLFEDCYKLTKVYIPNTVTEIEKYAFEDCKKLKKIVVPASVNAMGTSVFAGCKKLTIYLVWLPNSYSWTTNWNPNDRPVKRHLADNNYPNEDNNHSHEYVLEVANNSYLATEATCTKKAKYYKSCACGKKGTETFEGAYFADHTVDSDMICTVCHIQTATPRMSYKKISNSRGYCLTSVNVNYDATKIIIPSTYNGMPVTEIGTNAFRGCSKLKEVVIPESIKTIGTNAFYECKSLTSVTIPNSVTDIDALAFYACESLMDVSIGSGVINIEASAFKGCKNLTNIDIPDNVKNIGDYAFSYCTNLKNVNIGNGLTRIEDFTFSSCTSLKTVNIGSNVTNIGAFAFSDCKNLLGIVIPSNVTAIEQYAFSGCSILSTIVIGHDVTVIEERAFEGCYGLTTAIFENVNGWSFNNNTQIPADTLSNSSLAAHYLRSIYTKYTLKRN